MNEKKLLKKARKSLSEANYDLAKQQYQQLVDANPKEPIYHFEAGIAYYNSHYQRENALGYFQKALEASVQDTIAEIYFYLGKTHHYLGNYEQALANFEIFKKFILADKDDGFMTTRVDAHIKMCQNALALKEQEKSEKSSVEIRNLHQNINSRYAEYGSATNSSGSIMVFTTRDRDNVGKRDHFDSKKHEDIYFAKKDDTTWTKRVKIDESKEFFDSKINTKKHDAVIGFSANDDKLFIYRKNGIWVSELKNGKYGTPTEIKEINSKGHEPSSFITKDGKTLYFVSNKFDSKGGRDIFVVGSKNSFFSTFSSINLNPFKFTPLKVR
jgi:tetratricopeptide (TPR) repeat protein